MRDSSGIAPASLPPHRPGNMCPAPPAYRTTRRRAETRPIITSARRCRRAHRHRQPRQPRSPRGFRICPTSAATRDYSAGGDRGPLVARRSCSGECPGRTVKQGATVLARGRRGARLSAPVGREGQPSWTERVRDSEHIGSSMKGDERIDHQDRRHKEVASPWRPAPSSTSWCCSASPPAATPPPVPGADWLDRATVLNHNGSGV